jgi:2-hydroxy-6-oxonona-2,4-dienedioate hydrolase
MDLGSGASEHEMAWLERAAACHETPCGTGTVVWRAWGEPGPQPPVVLLHGGSGSWTHWVRNIPALLAQRRHVLVPDIPGFGDSAAPPDGEDADVLPGWLELGAQQLLGPTAVDLVGFSFGGLVGALWAQAWPARVARLVLVGAPALSAEPHPPLDLRRWDEQPLGPARLAAHRHNLRQLMLAHEATATDFAVALHARNIERDRLRRRRLMRTDLLARTLPTLRCPVHGIWGAEDVLYRGRLPVVEQALRTAPAFASLEFIEDAGHWVLFERAAAFNRTLAAVLGRGDAPG